MKRFIWALWIGVSIAMTAYFGYKLLQDEDKTTFLVGATAHGHYQIEMACESCHTDPFGGEEILQNACLNCHEDELNESRDSHPKKKFTDPRDADRIEIIDARYCVSCHIEHQEERTHPMGVSLPEDYCFHCHQTVGEDRESHAGLGFETCASAGCHNFHDNRALYENFLVEHANQPWLADVAKLSAPSAASVSAPRTSKTNMAFGDKMTQHPDINSQIMADVHGVAGISCGGCHTNTEDNSWLEKPGLNECKTCHQAEFVGFTSGKHGMRLSEKNSRPLTPMTPELSPLSFQTDAMHTEQGCNTCHAAHDFDTQVAAAETCLSCHADEHSLAYEASPHGQLWQQELAGELPAGSGVSCASCHMPSVEKTINGKKVIAVEHNQNANLRPNEKMIRPVCMECHSLEFSIDALADPALIKTNFTGKPSMHVESIDWAVKRTEDD